MKKYRILALLLLLLSLTTLCLGLACAEEADPTLPPDKVLYKQGDNKAEIKQIKLRLYELGYYNSSNLNREFNSTMTRTVKTFQEQNGLEVTGKITVADKEFLFSDAAQPYVEPTPTPAPTPEPLPEQRPLMDPAAPERDADGYLADGTEYFYENDEDGQWCYLSGDLQILINRYERPSVPLIWYETEIFMRNGQQFLTTETNPKRPGTRFSYPFDIATNNKYVLGFTDDFYGHRINRKEREGIVIRNGEVICDDDYSKRLHNLPNLDMMAQFPDGSLKCYRSSTITSEELLALGAVNVYCFGPVVISEGQIDEYIPAGYYDTKSPRQLLGMIEPNHYLLVSVQGRTKNSEGSGLRFPTDLMLQRGVVEGFNLDGGNTMALIFRGRMLNNLAKWKNKTFVRTVTSLIGVGISDNAIPVEEE
ncbi:MAG: phosphodiester glycosidase family protein [Clostridia bacterium]|nr:phosphodiester glycosidase family protein [Clostridia bacterium]